MATVSVIIPAYNSSRFLPEAIESVFAQTYKDYEIIVIDDGSTDNTKEVLEPYFDKIKYIYQQNQGAASARNTGIKHSHGENIAFLDADDIWLPEKLHTQVDYLDNNLEIAMVYTQSLWMSKDGRLLTGKKSRHRNLPSGDVFNILFLDNFIFTSSVMVRKRVLNTIGLFNVSFVCSEDRDLWLRIAREYKVAGIGKYLCKYRKTPGSLSKNKELRDRAQRLIIEQHYKSSQDSGRPIAPALYKKALSRLFFRIGKHNLELGKKDVALKNFFESLKYRPFNLRSIRHVLKTLLCRIMQMLSSKHSNELQDVQETARNVDGFLTTDEGKFLYRTAKNCHKGVIVEIGSFKGKSTIWLAKGSKAGNKVNIYAVDPHTGSSEHGVIWTLPELTENIKKAKVDDIVIPIIKTSEDAEKTWNAKPIEFLWIDGAHEYEMVKLDFDKWLPHLIDGGIIAFHDTITWPGPSRVVEEDVYKSKIFKVIGRIDSITFARKVGKTTLRDRLRNQWLLSNHFLRVGRRLRKKDKQEAKKYLLNAIKCNPFNTRAIWEFIRLFVHKNGR